MADVDPTPQRIAAAQGKAREIGGDLVAHAVELAFDGGWRPKAKDTHEAALEVLKRGIPLLMESLKKTGML